MLWFILLTSLSLYSIFSTDESLNVHGWVLWMYNPPWTRCGPYVAGIIYGYLLHIYKGKRIKLSKILVTVCWLLAIAGGLGVCYGVNFAAFFEEGKEKSRIENAFYMGFHRYVWGVVCGWVVFASIKGYGGNCILLKIVLNKSISFLGIVNSILSWKAFIPLAKTTYIGYLIHINILFIFMTLIRFSVEHTYFFEVKTTIVIFVSLAYQYFLRLCW